MSSGAFPTITKAVGLPCMLSEPKHTLSSAIASLASTQYQVQGWAPIHHHICASITVIQNSASLLTKWHDCMDAETSGDSEDMHIFT